MPHRVPKRHYFHFRFNCTYRPQAPAIDGLLEDWDSRFLVPDLMELEGLKAFAEVFLGWNEGGIYVAVNVRGKANPVTVDLRDWGAADCFEVWIDTRDARAMQRPTKHCHQFAFLPRGGGPDGAAACARGVVLSTGAAKPLAQDAALTVAARPHTQGYALEAAIPAQAMHGFDPIEHPHLGFTYYLNDTHLGAQWWSVNRPFRFRDNPSMWGTAVLVRE